MAKANFQKLQKALSLFGTKIKAVYTETLQPMDVAVRELKKMHPSPDPESSFEDDLGMLAHDYGVDQDELAKRYHEDSELNAERPERRL